MKTSLIVTSALLALTGSVAAQPDPAATSLRPPQLEQFASPSVTEISTSRVGNDTWRVIAGERQDHPFLVVEQIHYGRPGEPRVARQEMLKIIEIDRRRVDFANAFRSVELGEWRDGMLSFTVRAGRNARRCSLIVRQVPPPRPGTPWNGRYGLAPFFAKCDGRWDGPSQPDQPGNPGHPGNPGTPGHPGHPDQPDSNQFEKLGKACGAAFYNSEQRDQCMQLVLPLRYEVVPSIEACSAGFYNPADRLKCLASVATTPRDPAPTISQCNTSFYSASDRLSCISIAVEDNLPRNVIPACTGALYGAKDQLTCMRTLVDSSRNPIDLINYCKQNSYGSDKILACLSKFNPRP